MKTLSNKQKRNIRWQNFLNTFFDKHNCYQFKEINGFVLEMRKSASQLRDWEIAIYTKKSWNNRTDFMKLKTCKPNNKQVRGL